MLPCLTSQTVIQLHDPVSKVFSRMASLRLLQTCLLLISLRHKAGLTTFGSALSPEGKVFTRESQPSLGHGKEHTVSSHALCAAGKLEWIYRHLTSPHKKTSQKKELVKFTHTPLTIRITFIATALPKAVGCHLYPWMPLLSLQSDPGGPQSSAHFSSCSPCARGTTGTLQASHGLPVH